MTDLVHRLLSMFNSGEQDEAIEAPGKSFLVAGERPTPRAQTMGPGKTAEGGFLDFLEQEPGSRSSRELITGSIRLLDIGGDAGELPLQLQSIASGEIENGLSPDDFRHPDKDGGFVFCFSDPDLDQAQMKTAAISERIRTRVADELPDIAHRYAIQPNVTRVDRRFIVGSDMPPFEALILAIDRIRNEQREQWHASRANAVRVAQLLFRPAWSPHKGVPTLNRCIIDRTGLQIGSRQPSPTAARAAARPPRAPSR